jgi:hypothetical protein
MKKKDKEMPPKKRVHQQQLIRKRKSVETEPKKRRTSYLKDHLLIFPINDKFRVSSQKTPQDCFVCTLQYLSILDNLSADMLRTFVTGRGATVEQMIAVLRVVLRDTYDRIDTERVTFDTLYQLFDLLSPSTATIIGLSKPSGLGHIVLLAKDANSRIGIVDPQSETICIQQQCDDYVRPYITEPILIFTHK